MTRYLKRPISILLTVIMILSLFTIIPVSAASTYELCGAIVGSGGYYNLSSGDYILTGDVDTNAIIRVNSGVTATIDLNGYNIDRGLADSDAVNNGYVIYVNGGSLTITDTSDDRDGMITGGNNTNSGGGIYCKSGSLTIEAGKISGNKALGGAGVHIDGGVLFTMNGGSIDHNTSTGTQNAGYSGGGAVFIYPGATFTMNGGTIGNNTAYRGGGVLDFGTFNLAGGEISENHANFNGGGLFVGNSNTVCIQTGGTITGNTANNYGGGVYQGNAAATYKLSGGTITNNTSNSYGSGFCYYNGIFELSGSPVVSGNNNYSSKGNLYIATGKTISVTGDLDSAAHIGVYSASNGVFTSGLSGHGGADVFTSDRSSYGVTLNSSGEAQLVRTYTVIFKNEDGTALQTGLYAEGEIPSYDGETPTKAPDAMNTYAFAGWRIGSTTYGAEEALPAVTGSDMIFTAVFINTPKRYTVTFNDYDGTQLSTVELDAGTVPAYSGSEPTREAPDDAEYIYVFSGWNDGTADYAPGAALPGIISDVTYTAKFDKVHAHDGVPFTEWTSTTSLPSAAGSYYLANNVTISSTWNVPAGTVNLCLNGRTIYYTGTSPAIKIDGAALVLHDTAAGTGMITTGAGYNANSSNGGGVFISNGSFTMNGGTITGFTARGGGGVFIDDKGSFTMNDGVISGNESTNNNTGGGGVCLNSGSGGSGCTFTMNGGEISGNNAYNGGGILVLRENDIFSMNGGTITGNTVNSDSNFGGGGIFYYAGSLRISGKVNISSNTCGDDINNILIYKTKMISITGDLDPAARIGVRKSESFSTAFTSGLSGHGSVSNFISDLDNYFIKLNSSSEAYFALKHTVTFRDEDGTALQTGLYAEGEIPSYDGETPTKESNEFCSYTFAGWRIGSTTYGAEEALPAVTGNTTYTAVYDADGVEFTITWKDYDGTDLYTKDVTYGTIPVYGGDAPTRDAAGHYEYTFMGWSTDGSTVITVPAVENEATYIAVYSEVHRHGGVSFQTPWTSTTGLPSAAGSYYLTADVTLSEKWTVPAGTVNLCLNGCNITYSGSGGTVILLNANNSTLNLYDMESGAGTISGGTGETLNSNRLGGGVYIGNGTFNMYGGKISGNQAKFGGGVLVLNSNSYFNMYGGEISNNTASNSGNAGGGVWVENGRLTMYGGTITGNKATSGTGGGIFISNGGRLVMSGGTITGNSAVQGGGVYKAAKAVFNISGGSVINNTCTSSVKGNNIVLVSGGTPLNITGQLGEDNIFGVMIYDSESEAEASGALTLGLPGNGSLDNFTKNDSRFFFLLDEDGEAEILALYTITFKNDNTTLSSKQYVENEVPVYEGSLPTKAEDSSYTYTFEGWNLNGFVYSGTLPAVSDDTTYTAFFAKTSKPGITGIAKINSTTYNDLQTALDTAKNNSGTNDSINKTVILQKDYTLTSSITIPAGVTLRIPYTLKTASYRSNNWSSTTNFTMDSPPYYGDVTYDENKTQSEYCRLTLGEGVEITVNGTLLICGDHYAAVYGDGGPTRSAVHDFGRIVMSENSSITVNNGAKLFAWGYITGDGSITANSGAKVYELMQICDFRGGNNTLDMYQYTGDLDQLPFNQYYIQNIESRLKIYSGATEYAYSDLAVKALFSYTHLTNNNTFIGSNGMFILKNSGSYLEKRYDAERDLMLYDLYGDAEIGSMTVTIMSNYSLNTADYYLPINNIQMEIHGGKMITEHDVLFLPGSSLIVDEGATVEIRNGGNIVVADKNIGKYSRAQSSQYPCIPVQYTPTRAPYLSRTWENTDTAFINVNGEIIIASGGSLATTANSSDQSDVKIYSSTGNGVFKIIAENQPEDSIDRWVNDSIQGINIVTPYLTDGVSGDGEKHDTDAERWLSGSSAIFTQVENVWGDYRYIEFYDMNAGSGSDLPDNPIVRCDPIVKDQLTNAYVAAGIQDYVSSECLSSVTFDVNSEYTDSALEGAIKNVVRVALNGVEYSIAWLNYDDTPLDSASLAYGICPSYSGETPEKAGTVQYSYVFSGWSDGAEEYEKDGLPAVSGNTVYTAIFDEAPTLYDVTWVIVNAYGAEQEIKATLAYGATPTVPSGMSETYVTVESTSTGNRTETYAFTGWDKDIAAVTDDVTYTAVYERVFSQHSLSLNDSIDTNFYFTAPSGSDPAELYAEFTWGSGMSCTDSSLTAADGNMWKVTVPVAAKEMHDLITVVIRDKAANEVARETFKSSDYMYTVINTETSELAELIGYTEQNVLKLKDLCRSALAYGAAAQTYFGYNTDSLATEYLDDFYPDYSEITSGTFSTYWADEYTAIIHSDLREIGLYYNGLSLSLESKTELNIFCYRLAKYNVDNPVVAAVGNRQIVGVLVDSEQQEGDRAFVRFDITGIAPAELFDDIIIKFPKQNPFKLNAGTYMYMAMYYAEKYSSDETFRNLGTVTQTLYEYSEKSVTFFNGIKE